MTKIETVRHVINDADGNRVNRLEYEFAPDATEWEKEAVREYGCQSKEEFEDAIAWREAVDSVGGDVADILRGRDPSTGEQVVAPHPGRGRGP